MNGELVMLDEDGGELVGVFVFWGPPKWRPCLKVDSTPLRRNFEWLPTTSLRHRSHI